MADSESPLLGDSSNLSNPPEPAATSQTIGRKHDEVRKAVQRFLASKAKHHLVFAIIVLDVATILSEIFISLITCELNQRGQPWVRLSQQALKTTALIFSCLFLMELTTTLWVEGIKHLTTWFHCFDALVIVGSFIIDLLERGVAEEIASLVVILRLWRFVKIVNEFSVEASEQMDEFRERLSEAEKENAELRSQLRRYKPRSDVEAAGA